MVGIRSEGSDADPAVPDPSQRSPDAQFLPPVPAPKATSFTSQAPLSQRVKAVAEEAVSRGVVRSIGVGVYDMASGQGYGLNHDRLFKPASVIKLAVLVGAYRAREKMPPGQFDNLRPDLERMITVSDNPATRRLVRRLGARRINAAIQELGIRRFRVGTSGSQTWVLQGSQAAPADTALLLAKIARREVVNPQACDEMLALLGAQTKRRRIPAALPETPDLWIGNKTGTLNGIVNDSAVVLQPQRGIAYTLAIYTAGARSEKAGEELLADLSAVVYGYLASRR
jgi:beta-lactamase class A